MNSVIYFLIFNRSFQIFRKCARKCQLSFIEESLLIMSSSTANYIRPISVMSLLADQMESSSLTENKTCDNDDKGIPITSYCKYDANYVSFTRKLCNII